MIQMKKNNGFATIEMLTALACLSLLISFAVPTLMRLSRQRRAIETHVELIESAANIMERIVYLPYDQIEQQALSKKKLEKTLPRQLQSTQVEITITKDDAAGLSGKKIQLRLLPPDQLGRVQRPVRITSWVFPKEVSP